MDFKWQYDNGYCYVSDYSMDWWFEDGGLNMPSYGKFLDLIKFKSLALYTNFVKLKTVLSNEEEWIKQLMVCSGLCIMCLVLTIPLHLSISTSCCNTIIIIIILNCLKSCVEVEVCVVGQRFTRQTVDSMSLPMELIEFDLPGSVSEEFLYG
jgi:hypothetical protein